MIIRTMPDITPSEITPKDVFENRRDFIQKAGFGLLTGAAAMLSQPVLAATASSRAADGTGGLVARTNAPSAIKNTYQKDLIKSTGYVKTSYGADEKLTHL